MNSHFRLFFYSASSPLADYVTTFPTRPRSFANSVDFSISSPFLVDSATLKHIEFRQFSWHTNFPSFFRFYLFICIFLFAQKSCHLNKTLNIYPFFLLFVSTSESRACAPKLECMPYANGAFMSLRRTSKWLLQRSCRKIQKRTCLSRNCGNKPSHPTNLRSCPQCCFFSICVRKLFSIYFHFHWPRSSTILFLAVAKKYKSLRHLEILL